MAVSGLLSHDLATTVDLGPGFSGLTLPETQSLRLNAWVDGPGPSDDLGTPLGCLLPSMEGLVFPAGLRVGPGSPPPPPHSPTPFQTVAPRAGHAGGSRMKGELGSPLLAQGPSPR